MFLDTFMCYFLPILSNTPPPLLIKQLPNIFYLDSKAKNLLYFSIKWLKQEAESILDEGNHQLSCSKTELQSPKSYPLLRQFGS